MEKFDIPEKRKCPSNGYTVQRKRDLIDEMCDEPSRYSEEMRRSAIYDAITIYQYSEYISRDWIEYVIRRLSREEI